MSIRGFESYVGWSNGYVKNLKNNIGTEMPGKLFLKFPRGLTAKKMGEFLFHNSFPPSFITVLLSSVLNINAY